MSQQSRSPPLHIKYLSNYLLSFGFFYNDYTKPSIFFNYMLITLLTFEEEDTIEVCYPSLSFGYLIPY